MIISKGHMNQYDISKGHANQHNYLKKTYSYFKGMHESNLLSKRDTLINIIISNGHII